MSSSGEVLSLIQQRQGYVNTSIPARIISYDAGSQTCSVEVVIKRPYMTKNASSPVRLNEVPVGFYYGSDWVIASPLHAGDAVLLIFPMFDISPWLTGNKETTYDPRGYELHNIDGAFAIPIAFTYNSPTRDPRFLDKLHITKGDNFITMGDEGIVISAGATSITLSMNGDVTMDVVGETTINTTHTTINSDTTINGHLSILGTMQAYGVGGAGTSTGSITGNLEINNGNLVVDGTITDNNTNLTSHTHTGDSGGSTGTPI